MSDDRRCLVVPARGLAELVFSLPTLAALAATERRLLPWVEAQLVPLAEVLPGVERVVERPPPGSRVEQQVATLRRLELPEAVLLERRWRTSALLRAAGIPVRRGVGGALGRWLLTHPVPPPRESSGDGPGDRRHRSELGRELLEAMGAPAPPDWLPRLSLPAALAERGEERLGRAGIGPGEHPLVALLPGSGRRRKERWPWRCWADLARLLRRQLPGVRIVLAPGKEDIWPGVRIHETTGHIHPVVGPDLDAAGLAAVLARCDLVAGTDPGPLGLAAALGVPTVTLAGRGDADRWAPRGAEHRLVEAPRGRRGKLGRLTAEPVAEALLDGLRSAPSHEK